MDRIVSFPFWSAAADRCDSSLRQTGRLCLLGLCLAPALAAGRQAAGPIALRLKLKPGQVFRYQTTARLRTTMQAIGLPGPPAAARTFTSSDRSVVQMKVIRTRPDGDTELTATTLSD
ncbi:MAG TPA: hypothetical protein VKU00_24800, partial [Chthonomonadaceae bacterium]|nr:hypothetical protein [Chthonomonadaceae bacterium]